jgi:hypothetical protein
MNQKTTKKSTFSIVRIAWSIPKCQPTVFLVHVILAGPFEQLKFESIKRLQCGFSATETWMDGNNFKILEWNPGPFEEGGVAFLTTKPPQFPLNILCYCKE